MGFPEPSNPWHSDSPPRPAPHTQPGGAGQAARRKDGGKGRPLRRKDTAAGRGGVRGRRYQPGRPGRPGSVREPGPEQRNHQRDFSLNRERRPHRPQTRRAAHGAAGLEAAAGGPSFPAPPGQRDMALGTAAAGGARRPPPAGLSP